MSPCGLNLTILVSILPLDNPKMTPKIGFWGQPSPTKTPRCLKKQLQQRRIRENPLKTLGFSYFLHSTHASKIASESIQNRSKISQVERQVAILAHPGRLLLPTWRQLCPLWTHHGDRNPCPMSPKIRKSFSTCSKMPQTLILYDFQPIWTSIFLVFRAISPPSRLPKQCLTYSSRLPSQYQNYKNKASLTQAH